MKQETPIQATPIPGFSSEVFSDEATKEKIRKHLSDINDVITEDDIKNVRTSMTVMPATEAETEKTAALRELADDDNKTPGIDNASLNVLED